MAIRVNSVKIPSGFPPSSKTRCLSIVPLITPTFAPTIDGGSLSAFVWSDSEEVIEAVNKLTRQIPINVVRREKSFAFLVLGTLSP